MRNIYKHTLTENSMKKEYKQVLSTLLILGLILTLSISLVSAAPFDGLRSFYEDWESGSGLDIGITKVFLGIIIFLLITTGLGFVPSIGDKKAIVITISAIIAIIATAYFTPEEVTAIVTSYTALGLTITVLLPFLVLAGLTYNAISQQDTILSILSQIAWGLFAVFSTYRFLIIWLAEGKLSTASYIVGIAVIVAALGFVFNKKIRQMVGERITEEDLEYAKNRSERARSREDDLAEATKRKKS